jgi:Domain of unknown function (DUF4365)
MANEELRTRGVGRADTIEVRSRQVLQQRLPPSEAVLVTYPDKYPNLDGLIEFFGETGALGLTAFFQLKATEADVTWYDADIAFLNYCYRSRGPVFLFLVNLPQDKVFWVHVDRKYIASVLGIKDLRGFDQQQKRIHFPSTQTIENNCAPLIDACRKHQSPSEDVGLMEAVLPEEPMTSEQNALASFEAIEAEFRKSSDVTERMLLYYSFVHMLTPFFLDSRGDQKRRKALTFLGISDSEERFMIENLMSVGLLARAGDLMYVTSKQAARTVLSHYMDTGRLDPEELTTRFSNDDEN